MEIKELTEWEYKRFVKKVNKVLELINETRNLNYNFTIVKKHIKDFYVSKDDIPFFHLLIDIGYNNPNFSLLLETIIFNLTQEEKSFLLNQIDLNKDNFLSYYLKKVGLFDANFILEVLRLCTSKERKSIFDCNLINVNNQSFGEILVFETTKRNIDLSSKEAEIKRQEALRIYNYLVDNTDYKYFKKDVSTFKYEIDTCKNTDQLLIDIVLKYNLEHFIEIFEQNKKHEIFDIDMIYENFAYPRNEFNKSRYTNTIMMHYIIRENPGMCKKFQKYNFLFCCLDRNQKQYDDGKRMALIQRLLKIGVVDINSVNGYMDIISYAITQCYKEWFVFNLLDICMKHGFDSKKHFMKILKTTMFNATNVDPLNLYNKLSELGFNLTMEPEITERLGVLNILSFKLETKNSNSNKIILREDKKAKFLAKIKTDLAQHGYIFETDYKDIRDSEELYNYYEDLIKKTASSPTDIYNDFINKILEYKQSEINFDSNVKLIDLYMAIRNELDEDKIKKLIMK